MTRPAVTHTGQTTGESGKVFAPPLDAAEIAAHIADSTDPHGSQMSVSVKLTTPKVFTLGDITLDANSFGADTVVYVLNSDGVKKADLDVERDVIVGRNLKIVASAGYDAVYDNGNVNGNIVIDWTNGNVQKITLTGNVTQVLFTNPPWPGNYRLWIYQDGTGGHTIADNWDADCYWGGTAPVISADANNFDLGVFEYDGASTYAAQLAQGIDGLGFNPP